MIVIWITLNLSRGGHWWDPYPFILLNLMLSLQAAYAGPVIMMSQNRLAQLDRQEAHHDLVTDIRAEEEVREIIAHLERQDAMLRVLLARVDGAAVDSLSS
jgi:uncharacterized membrane protein